MTFSSQVFNGKDNVEFPSGGRVWLGAKAWPVMGPI